MICLTQNLPEINAESVALAKIKCTFSAYGNYPKIALFWVQTGEKGETNALLSLMDKNLCVYAKEPNEELALFLKSQNFDLVFADEKVADALKVKGERVCALCFEAAGKPTRAEGVSPREIYQLMRDDFKLNEMEFIADLSHRLRHGAAFCVKSESGAAVVQTAPKTAVITGFAVKKEFRGNGIGKEILKEIKDKTLGKIYLCCEDGVLPFYLKNSFNQIGFCKMGRI